MKKIYLSIIIMFAISLAFLGCQDISNNNKNTSKTNTDLDSCNTDSDCVPAACCHANSCTNKNYKPDCKGIMCSMECSSGTMDCGQGSCKCQNNKCTAVIAGSNTQIANPASVFCEDNKARLEIRTNADGSQYGVCIFDDNSECEEWAYYRGECKPGDNKLNSVV